MRFVTFQAFVCSGARLRGALRRFFELINAPPSSKIKVGQLRMGRKPRRRPSPSRASPPSFVQASFDEKAFAFKACF